MQSERVITIAEESRPSQTPKDRPCGIEVTDADLVVRLSAGDRSALAELVARWQASLIRIAYRIVGDQVEAEEVCQTVFLRLLESPGALRRPERFATWIRRTTVNTAINSAKRSSRQKHAMSRLYQARTEEVVSRPDELLARADEAARLAAGLAQLNPAERALLSMRFDEGLTFQEMATAMRRPASTIKSRTQVAIKRLRRIIGASE